MAPMVLLKFHPNITTKAVDWIIEKISAPESGGGANLLCRLVGTSKQGEPSLVVGASIERLLLEADEAILFHHKPYKSAIRLSEAMCSDAHGPSLGPETKAEGQMGEEDERKKSVAHGLYRMISSAEAVSLLMKILGQLEVGETEEVNVLPDISLHPRKPVISSMLRCGVLRTVYPVHEVPVLEVLERKWRATWFGFKPFCQREILEDVRDYYGKPVALYFGFMWTLAKALLQKSVFYLFLHLCLLQKDNAPLLSFTGVVWSRLFLHNWKVKSGALRTEWGSGEHMHRPRPGSPFFIPHNHLDNSAGSGWKRVCVSVFFLTLTVLTSFTAIATYLYIDKTLRNHLSEDQHKSAYSDLYLYIPDVLLSVTMMALDWLAVELSGVVSASPSSPNSLESQRYNQESVLPEVIVCCLFNHFAVCFYQALWLREFSALGHRISVQLATQCILNLLLSLLLPLAKKRRVRGANGTEAGVPAGLRQIHSQCDWPASNNSQTRCYIELLIIYCYAMLFSSISPQCLLWCWVTVFLKSWLDTWRLGWAVCRPLPCEAPVESIVIWEEVFLAVETLAVLGNTVLLQASTEAEKVLENLSTWEMMQVALVLQLLLLVLGGTAANVVLGFLQAVSWHAEQPEQRHHRHYRLQRQQQQHQLPPQAQE
ncbi:hypothetical protein ACEWY4_002841 [Coilia grayii]|uniref:Anoctamin n=1 Tax=Coilia grayii TaxID=363190 RepID=A0ABD1KPG8_9TELE